MARLPPSQAKSSPSACSKASHKAGSIVALAKTDAQDLSDDKTPRSPETKTRKTWEEPAEALLDKSSDVNEVPPPPE